jgi:hypothetical protein
MRTWDKKLGLFVDPEDRVELVVSDLSLARAFYAGVPAARLLARARLDLDQRDLDEARAAAKPSSSSFDALVMRLLPGEQSSDRVRRAVVRHTRTASNEGPLRASERAMAALVHAVAFSADVDASSAEALSLDVPRDVGLAAASIDRRLALERIDHRVPLFEACVRFATAATAGPWGCQRILEGARALDAQSGVSILRPSATSLYPRVDPEIDEQHCQMVLLERAELEAFLARDPRELAKLVTRAEGHEAGTPPLDRVLADMGKLLAKTGGLVLAVSPPEPGAALSLPSLPPSSWMPSDWSAPDAVARLSDALERGVTTVPRLRGLVARGGDAALDAIGAELLRVSSLPFASAAFAELLARSGRPRDVMRLVTYFAVAPDPNAAARALSLCPSPELPALLGKWLEAMLPSDGGQANAHGDPETSSGARLAACVAALEPYPQLHRAVKPLLARLVTPG